MTKCPVCGLTVAEPPCDTEPRTPETKTEETKQPAYVPEVISMEVMRLGGGTCG